MRILVTSDSHNSPHQLKKLIEHYPDIDDIFFLGDGIRDAWSTMESFPKKRIHMVAGNCDLVMGDSPRHKNLETVGGKKIFYTHGDRYNVKLGLEMLKGFSKKEKPNLVLFGHTHIPHLEIDDGIYFVNPGAISRRGSGGFSSYCIIDLEPNEPRVEFFRMEPYEHYIVKKSELSQKKYEEALADRDDLLGEENE